MIESQAHFKCPYPVGLTIFCPLILETLLSRRAEICILLNYISLLWRFQNFFYQDMHFQHSLSRFVLNSHDYPIKLTWAFQILNYFKFSKKSSTHTLSSPDRVYFSGQNSTSGLVVKLYSFTFSSAQMHTFLGDSTLQLWKGTLHCNHYGMDTVLMERNCFH